MIRCALSTQVPDADYKWIKGRCSHGRGAVLQHVRPVIDALFTVNTKKAAVVRKNAALVKKLLLNNTFYFVVRISIVHTKITLT